MECEYLPILTLRDGELIVTGKNPRPLAHGSSPTFHATAIIAAVLPDGRFLLSDKTEKQIKKGHRILPGHHIFDCFGGHMNYDDIPAQELSAGLSAATFLKCATRELSEELLMSDGSPFSPNPDRFIPVGMYTLENDHNREYSWVFLYRLESFGPYASEDTLVTDGREETICQPILTATFEEILAMYGNKKLSDALGRVLSADGGKHLLTCLNK